MDYALPKNGYIGQPLKDKQFKFFKQKQFNLKDCLLFSFSEVLKNTFRLNKAKVFVVK
jgi:hypothetical protein